jgi:predicted CopG family antitoxin
MNRGNKSYKQILIDNDNYKTLKEMGKTGDSFNSVVSQLINRFRESDKLVNARKM